MQFRSPTSRSLASFYIELEQFLLFDFGGKSMYMKHQAWQQITRYGKIRISSPEVLPSSNIFHARELDEF